MKRHSWHLAAIGLRPAARVEVEPYDAALLDIRRAKARVYIRHRKIAIPAIITHSASAIREQK